MATPFLSRPSRRYQTSYLVAAHEFAAEGLLPKWNFEILEQRFDEYVEVLLQRESDPMPGYVPQRDLWLIVEETYVGTIGIRHHLTPALERIGGHIGYRIRPSRRRRGYGTLQCRLALSEARTMGLTRVLITCDDTNSGSAKIIEACGGVLQDKIDAGQPVLTRRYWVEV
jgi:predicted acetyltransferase